jgi:hypothetical protein
MEFRTPWDPDPPSADPVPKPRDTEDTSAPKKPRGRRPAGWSWGEAETDVDFVYCELTITGPAAEVERFAGVARGSGVIPWQLDFDTIEEDIFNLAVSPAPAQRRLTVAGCRLLARQFRERVEARQAKAAALVGNSLACPFDLQTLLPLPHHILRLGPAHSDSLAWLRRHWGPPEGLRKVAALEKPRPGKRLPADNAIVGYGFFSRERPPTAAIETIATSWPPLTFRLRHQSPMPGDRWTG